MKNIILAYLPTLLRHCFTALATVGTLLLTKGLITPSDVSAVNAGGSSIAAALVVIFTPILSRLAITLLGKLPLSGLSSATDKATAWLLWICIGTAVGGLGGLGLLSCSPAQMSAAGSIPIHGKLFTNYGSLGYDSKSGIDVEIDAQTLAKISKPAPPEPPAPVLAAK